MATNDILPFCPTDTGTNLPTQGDYAVAATRTSGAVPGVASSKYNNKPLRQATLMASQLAQFLCDRSGANILDDGTTAGPLGVITAMLTPLAPVVQTFAASGTYNQTYIFFIAAGSATAAATYTNNGVTYTVIETVAAGTTLVARGNNVPQFSGTLTKASGTGDATLTFYAFRKPVALKVTVVGGGGAGGGGAATGGATVVATGGGGGGGAAIKTIRSGFGVTETVTIGAAGAAPTAGANAGGNGGTSSFGAHASATGGTGGAAASASAGSSYNQGGAGGVGSSGDVNINGSKGTPGTTGAGAVNVVGSGGASIFGGQIPGSGFNSVGDAGLAYGGGGAGSASINSQSAKSAGAGAAGVVVVEELYQ